MVGAPFGHYRIDIGECAISPLFLERTGFGPGLIGSFIQNLMHIFGSFDGFTFGDL